jgi:DNA-binding response OmpR family regulator
LLVVDDEPEIRSLLCDYFGRSGFEVQSAQDAAAARITVAQQPPDLALLDVNMPGENGLSLASWLRDTHPRMGIVMLTSAADSVDRIVGLELGADDYIPKPFELREVLARVRAVLRRSQLPARHSQRASWGLGHAVGPVWTLHTGCGCAQVVGGGWH